MIFLKATSLTMKKCVNYIFKLVFNICIGEDPVDKIENFLKFYFTVGYFSKLIKIKKVSQL